jgi:hypothetical protein
MALPAAQIFERRPGWRPIIAIIAYLAFFIAVILVASLTSPIGGALALFLWVFVGMALAFVAYIIVAAAAWRKFEVDAQGVRCAGRPGGNFQVSWNDLSRIEVVRHRPHVPRMYVFRGRDETVIARFSPGELGAAAGEGLASIVEARAKDAGLPIVRV